MTQLAAQLLQILVPTVLVLALAGVLTGVLYAHERFTMPAVVSIVWNLVIIAFMVVWHDAWGVYALAWGTLVGTVVELILLGFAMRARRRALSRSTSTSATPAAARAGRSWCPSPSRSAS